MEVADQIVVMDKGRIEQVGSPGDIYEHPATPFVHDFIGESIVVPVTVDDGVVRYGNVPTGLDAQGLGNGAARLFVRPNEMQLVNDAGTPFKGIVRQVHGIGPARRVEVALEGGAGDATVEVEGPRNFAPAVGRPFGLAVRRYRLFAD